MRPAPARPLNVDPLYGKGGAIERGCRHRRVQYPPSRHRADAQGSRGSTGIICFAASPKSDAGIWQTKTVHGTKHPRLQILTIEDLLEGKKIDMPAQQEIRSFKQAPKAKGKKKAEDAKLF